MLTMQVKGVREATRFLKQAGRQVRFATAVALTRTAKDAKGELDRSAPQHLDRPTPFTKRAIGTERATKTKLRSRVYVKDLQAEYLRFQIDGGVRIVSGAGTGVPVRRRLNKYGNIPGRRRGLVKGQNEFVGTVRGVSGVWRRTKKGVRLMVAFERRTKYRPRFPFYAIAEQTAERRFPRRFRKALDEALRTAR